MRALVWGPADRERLKLARRRLGHTQEECAQELSRLGAPVVPAQATVSNWESGRTHRPPDTVVRVIKDYCAVLDTDEQNSPDATPALSSSPSDGADRASESEASFETAVAELTGARPLTTRQARFLDTLVSRLESGPPMSKADGDAVLLLAEALGLLDAE